jgi:acetyl-CoA carboxylase biotin carboxyl carrier protein
MAKSNNEIKERVKALYDIMSSENLYELEIDSKEYSLYIKRKSDDDVSLQPQIIREVARAFVPEKEVGVVATKVAAKPAGETIKSPITGMFYRSAAPSTPALASQGDIIEKGKTLCIVEAMKVMNEIKATDKVRIVKVIAHNAKPVTAGQDLFEIEKV